MEKIRKAQGFRAKEIFRNEVVDITEIELTHQFEKNRKWLMNRECDMVVRAIVGAIKIEIEGQGIRKLSVLTPLVHIPKGAKYRWTVSGHRSFRADFITTPPWYPEQHEVLE